MAQGRLNLMDPPIEDLLDKVDSKFTLVALGALRARQVNAYYNSLGEGLGRVVPPQVASVSGKPLSIAFEEVAAGKATYVRLDPEELAAAEAAEAAEREAAELELLGLAADLVTGVQQEIEELAHEATAVTEAEMAAVMDAGTDTEPAEAELTEVEPTEAELTGAEPAAAEPTVPTAATGAVADAEGEDTAEAAAAPESGSEDEGPAAS